ncbi:hypothetical protein Q9L58_010598 [Maublancomyces gigas]|uniref:Uncharacterized protein n=1 Tax=Discina gigas TaxID=1032678 RepID=A0ABR3G3N9_9PEZI
MADMFRPTSSEIMVAAMKDRDVFKWLKSAATHSLPRTDFGSLQIAYAAAHKDSTQELPEWAWVEYQVIHDNHATTTKAPAASAKSQASSRWYNGGTLDTQRTHDEHQAHPDSPHPTAPPETAIEITAPARSSPAPTPETTPQASAEFNNELNYMPGLVGESPVPVHYCAWLIRNTVTPIMSRLEQADAAIIALHCTVEKQTRAINSLNTTLQELS